MSGGSYNYMFSASPFGFDMYEESLVDMREVLLRLNYSPAATNAFTELIDMVREVEARHSRLSGIMKAIEWYESGDWSKGAISDHIDLWVKSRND